MKSPLANIWGRVISLPDNTSVGAFCDIGDPDIGQNCKIQCHVSIPPGWKIGNNVFIGPGVRFANDRHPDLSGNFEVQCGVIEDNVVIGMGALILPVNIGKGAIIGAGSVVIKDVGAGHTVVGNPAKPIYTKPIHRWIEDSIDGVVHCEICGVPKEES